MADYVPTPPTPAQAKCRHPARYRNRAGDECAICGSRKEGSRWVYLREDQFRAYVDGPSRLSKLASLLVLRPAYGQPVAESGLPQGGPAGKGLPLDSGIPGQATFAKPEDDIREPRVDDENIYRVENADDLLKDRDRIDTREDNADKHDGIGAYGEGAWDSSSKTKFPYRDNRPNTHTARVVVERYLADTARSVVIRPFDRIKVAVKLTEIAEGLNPKVQRSAKRCKTTVKRVDVGHLRWVFSVDCGNGAKVVKLQATRPKNVVKLVRMDLKMSCSCPFWQWQGPEHNAKTQGYLLGNPRGTASTPDVKDPDRTHLVCKHVAAVLDSIRGWEIPAKKG